MSPLNKQTKQSSATPGGTLRRVNQADFEPGGSVYAQLLAEGLKESHLALWQIRDSKNPSITQDHVDLFVFLHQKGMDIPTVIEEMKGLDSMEARMLMHLYDHGLRATYLLQASKGGEHFSSLEETMWSYFLIDKKLPPEDIVNELRDLSIIQMRALQESYDLGLRGEHLRNWQPPSSQGLFGTKFSELHGKVLHDLLSQRKAPLSPEQAITVISSVPLSILQDPKKLEKRIQSILSEGPQVTPTLRKS